MSVLSAWDGTGILLYPSIESHRRVTCQPTPFPAVSEMVIESGLATLRVLTPRSCCRGAGRDLG